MPFFFLLAVFFLLPLPSGIATQNLYVDPSAAAERAKIFSLALCSHETNRTLVGGSPKKLSFFNFLVTKTPSDSISVAGYCNSTQSHPQTARSQTDFRLTMKTVFPLHQREGYDYGTMGSLRIRIHWTLENSNPLLDPSGDSTSEVRYHSLELFPDLPLLGLWSPLNPYKIEIYESSESGMKGVALRNLRGIQVETKAPGTFYVNYTNLEDYYRSRHQGQDFAQGVGLAVHGSDQIYGCIYSSYRSDGAIETPLNPAKCAELAQKSAPRR